VTAEVQTKGVLFSIVRIYMISVVWCRKLIFNL